MLETFPNKKPGDPLEASHVNALSGVCRRVAGSMPGPGQVGIRTSSIDLDRPAYAGELVTLQVTGTRVSGFDARDSGLYFGRRRWYSAAEGAWRDPDDQDRDLLIDARDSDLIFAVGMKVVCHWSSQRGAFLPVAVPPAQTIRFQLAGNLSLGGYASANLLEWGGSSYVADGDMSFDVYDEHGLYCQWNPPVGQDGARGYAEFFSDLDKWVIREMENQAKWIIFYTNEDLDGESTSVQGTILEYGDGYATEEMVTNAEDFTFYASEESSYFYAPAGSLAFAVFSQEDGVYYITLVSYSENYWAKAQSNSSGPTVSVKFCDYGGGNEVGNAFDVALPTTGGRAVEILAGDVFTVTVARGTSEFAWSCTSDYTDLDNAIENYCVKAQSDWTVDIDDKPYVSVRICDPDGTNETGDPFDVFLPSYGFKYPDIRAGYVFTAAYTTGSTTGGWAATSDYLQESFWVKAQDDDEDPGDGELHRRVSVKLCDPDGTNETGEAFYIALPVVTGMKPRVKSGDVLGCAQAVGTTTYGWVATSDYSIGPQWVKAQSDHEDPGVSELHRRVSVKFCDPDGTNVTGDAFYIALPANGDRYPSVWEDDVLVAQYAAGATESGWVCVSDYLDDPLGTIKWFSGSVETIPAGWAICDGENDTVDLRGRFIMCMDTEEGAEDDEDEIGDTGGFRYHGQTENNHDAHRNHRHAMNSDGSDKVQVASGSDVTVFSGDPDDDVWTSGVDYLPGESDPPNITEHYGDYPVEDTDNRPRYYVLAAMQRVS